MWGQVADKTWAADKAGDPHCKRTGLQGSRSSHQIGNEGLTALELCGGGSRKSNSTQTRPTLPASLVPPPPDGHSSWP